MKHVTLLSALVVGVAIAAAPAFASHSWNGYHWARTSNPFTIKVGDNVGSAWDGYFNTALTDWSKDTAGNPLNAIRVGGATDAKKCRPVTGTVQVCDARYGGRWLGLAQIWLSGLHITQAISKMNDAYYYPGSYYDTPAWRGAVMCQEVGHTWGLDHQDESGADFHTCMDYATNPDADNMHPNYHDWQELAIIYAHTNDGGTTIASLATSNALPVRVQRSDRIKDSTITEEFADGSKRVTHLRWAIGSPRD
jgi:hypothetical protein